MKQRLELGTEYVPPGEAAIIERIVAAMRAGYAQAHQPGGFQRPAKRKFHPKAHGLLYVRWECVSQSELPSWLLEHLPGGVFEPGKVFKKVKIRPSNGNSHPGPDGLDIHAVSIKIEDVEYPDGTLGTQDFLLADSPGFFCKDAADYVPLGSDKIFQFLMPTWWNPLSYRYREAWLLGKSILKAKPISPLALKFWSQLPSRLGKKKLAVKYSVRPRYVPDVTVNKHDPIYLRHALVDQLRPSNRRGIVLDFMIQPQIDAVKMPIEDPRIIWSEDKSPFIKVATIYIPPQDFNTPERDQEGENLSFDPGHTLEVHRPLGGIARVRMAVYRVMSEFRRRLNGASLTEPTT
jgi:hypothetical protein